MSGAPICARSAPCVRSCGVLWLFLPIIEKARGLPVFGASCFLYRIGAGAGVLQYGIVVSLFVAC